MAHTRGFPKEISIGSRRVGEGQPAYVIAEIGANFDRDLDKAKRLVEAAKESGADCAKFQSFLADRIVSAQGFARMNLHGVHGSWGRPVNEVFRDAEFPREWHHEIAAYCRRVGIDFSTSPYDTDAVDLCEALDVPFIKIGSGEITWLEMLTYIAQKKRPMILGTGDATISEIDEAIRTIEATGNNQLILLQCITNYPSKTESANINVLKSYQSAFDILTGYSDHSPGIVVALGAIALGAVVIEKHFTLSKLDKGPDHPHSMEAPQFARMVTAIRELELALGSTRKLVVDEESETVFVQRRSLYARRRIPAGKVIEEIDIEVLRPALGLAPKHKSALVGRTARVDLEEGTPLLWEHI
jgi:sialic acid synthase SpsE